MPPASKGSIQVEGCEIQISNPDKLMWEEPRIDKAQFLQKLAELAPYLLRYCRNRYLTTIRFPNGAMGKSFYQKNAPEPTPDYVRVEPLEDTRYVILDSLPVLLWLGNLACLEFHPSFHEIGSTLPCEWVIDLDPSLEYEPRMGEAAVIIGDILHSLQIEAVPKTSGATGIQIYIPIQRGYTFDQLRSIGKFVATYAVQQHPQLFTIERLKKQRGNRIYFDYLQHWPGKTLSSPYTPRARKGAPVSTPLRWEELRRANPFEPWRYNLNNIGERLRQHGDLISACPEQSLDPILTFLERRRLT